jgi:hypothetical protein
MRIEEIARIVLDPLSDRAVPLTAWTAKQNVGTIIEAR